MSRPRSWRWGCGRPGTAEQLQAARLRAAELLAQQQQVQQTLSAIEASIEAQMRQAQSGGRAP